MIFTMMQIKLEPNDKQFVCLQYKDPPM